MEGKRKNTGKKTQLILKHSKKKQNNTYQHTQVPRRKSWHGNKHVWEP